MRRISFIFAIFGIFVLIGLLFWIPYKKIRDVRDLQGVVSNDKVVLSGFVKDEKMSSGKFIFKINGILVVCEGCKSFGRREVQVKGLISKYKGNKEIDVLEANILS